MTRIPTNLGLPQGVPQNLFNSVDSSTLNPNVTKGSLITFNYLYWAHDPYPLVIVTDMLPGNRLRGVNLHYLTFNYIKAILKNNAGNAAFSYASIKSDAYIINAFRAYKWSGIRTVKKLDSNFILTVMATVRSFDPTQLEAIRQNVQQQISQQVNPTADSMTQQQEPYGG